MVDIHKQVVRFGSDDEIVVEGCRRSGVKTAVDAVLCVLTLGIYRLFTGWFVPLRFLMNFTKCPLSTCSHVYVTSKYKEQSIEEVHSFVLQDSSLAASDDVWSSESLRRYFIYKNLKCLWQEDSFQLLKDPLENRPLKHFHQQQGLTPHQRHTRLQIYGENTIRVEVTPWLRLLITQGLNPFYLFQCFSILLWCFDDYYYYASCIFIISVVSLVVQMRQIRMNEVKLKETVGSGGDIFVFEDDNEESTKMASEWVVPGDLIDMTDFRGTMLCDVVLLNGKCVVNECMLTGESTPITKSELPECPSDDALFKEQENYKHIIFSGTQVIQTRFYQGAKIKALVLSTGFRTAKGRLIHSIMHPKPMSHKLKRDVYKFILCLSIIAFIGMIYTIVLMVMNGDTAVLIIVRTLDLITIVIPPALPAAITVGVIVAQNRLSKAGIFCISTDHISLCGTLDTFCFDKTGTLTQDGLDFKMVLPCVDQKFRESVNDMTDLSYSNKLIVAMATCHSLTIVDNVLVGDPLEMKMFQAANWSLNEDEKQHDDTMFVTTVTPNKHFPNNFKVDREATIDAYTTTVHNVDFLYNQKPIENTKNLPVWGITKQFIFSSKLQRMSVVVKQLEKKHWEFFCKGSPEMIVSLCRSETVPSDFHKVLENYTKEGLRVLAVAWKKIKQKGIKIEKLTREQLEQDMDFLGLLVFENQLKIHTTPIINTLNTSHINVIMITGDNLLTAVSVAKNCNMIGPSDQAIFVTSLPDDVNNQSEHSLNWSYVSNEGIEYDEYDNHSRIQCAMEKTHLVLTGRSWSIIRRKHPSFLPLVLKHGKVFARFSPEQKQQLVEDLMGHGQHVGMCGDGANDCGALKAADAGVSLSEAEASVASAFTCNKADIRCTVQLIREGRAALVTSFGVFKYMMSYSLNQFMSVCILYWMSSNLSDFGFLYIDILLLSVLGFTFSRTMAHETLHKHPPNISLFSISPFLSLLMQISINFFFQIFVWWLTSIQPWSQAQENTMVSKQPTTIVQSYVVTSIFSISSFQYISLSIVYAKGFPHRKQLFTNKAFFASIIILTILTSLIVLYPIPFPWFLNLSKLMPAPSFRFRIIILGLAALNFCVSFFIEALLVDYLIEKKYYEGRRDRQRMKEATFVIQPINGHSVPKNKDYFSTKTKDKNREENDIGIKENDTCLQINQGYSTFLDIELERTAELNSLDTASTYNQIAHPFNKWLHRNKQHKNLTELIEAETLYFDKVAAIDRKNVQEDEFDDESASDDGENSLLIKH